MKRVHSIMATVEAAVTSGDARQEEVSWECVLRLVRLARTRVANEVALSSNVCESAARCEGSPACICELSPIPRPRPRRACPLARRQIIGGHDDSQHAPVQVPPRRPQRPRLSARMRPPCVSPTRPRARVRPAPAVPSRQARTAVSWITCWVRFPQTKYTKGPAAVGATSQSSTDVVPSLARAVSLRAPCYSAGDYGVRLSTFPPPPSAACCVSQPAGHR